jgi:AraC family transcriptional activator of pobA
VVFVLRGRGVSFAEGAMMQYAPPALILVPAGSVHGFEFEPGTEGFVMSLTDDLLRDISRPNRGIATLFEKCVTLELPGEALRGTDLTQSFKMMAREFALTLPGHALALEGLLKVILANVLRLSHPTVESPDSAASRYRQIVMHFREHIETEFREGWSLADYASALKVSQSRLRNACLAVTEQSPMQLVHARILLEAKRQLRHTDVSVSEIAYSLGFDDPAYFTRFFSQRTGTSPRAFRLASRQTEGAGAQDVARDGVQAL